MTFVEPATEEVRVNVESIGTSSGLTRIGGVGETYDQTNPVCEFWISACVRIIGESGNGRACGLGRVEQRDILRRASELNE